MGGEDGTASSSYLPSSSCGYDSLEYGDSSNCLDGGGGVEGLWWWQLLLLLDFKDVKMDDRWFNLFFRSLFLRTTY